MENLKHTTKVKQLIKGQVDMGTFGLVELEVRELEQTKNELLDVLIELDMLTFNLNVKVDGLTAMALQECGKRVNRVINKATK